MRFKTNNVPALDCGSAEVTSNSNNAHSSRFANLETVSTFNTSTRPTRREFLGLSGQAFAAAALTPAAYAAIGRYGYRTGGFEVASSLYAWDLHDEGIEQILDNLQQMAGVNSVYLVALMHYEKRPLTSPTFPHNLVRKTWQAEDSKIYWHPDPKLYKRIKPELSANGWLSETDWLKVLITGARKRGLKTGAELSHTLMSLEKGQGEYTDCVQRNINGTPHKVAGRAYPLCPNNKDAQDYALALFSDLTENYDVDFVQTCMIPFMPGEPKRGLLLRFVHESCPFGGHRPGTDQVCPAYGSSICGRVATVAEVPADISDPLLQDDARWRACHPPEHRASVQ